MVTPCLGSLVWRLSTLSGESTLSNELNYLLFLHKIRAITTPDTIEHNSQHRDPTSVLFVSIWILTDAVLSAKTL